MYTTYAEHLNNASSKLFEKYKRPPVVNNNRYKPILPDYVQDMFERMDLANNVENDTGPSAIIDVQPDYRNPLLVIESLVIQLYDTFDAKLTSIFTPPAITAYCIMQLYALALLNDCTTSRSISACR